MSTVIVDQRPNAGKSAGNRKRLLRRLDRAIRVQIDRYVANRHLRDMDAAADITVPAQDLEEPSFALEPDSGATHRVLPGNTEYRVGDKLEKQRRRSGSGGGAGAGQGEAGEDAFSFALSREEFLNLLFEDLALPELLKKELTDVTETHLKRGGVTRYGTPGTLSVLRTLRASIGRRVAATSINVEEVAACEQALADARAAGDPELVARLELELQVILRRGAAMPFIDPVDLRHRSLIETPTPRSAAVMFCLMDVSASMDEQQKDLAKRFFTLLYLFLNRKYKKVEIVFVRHTDEAEEVDEDTFFHGRKSGGTKVLAALVKMKEMIDSRFPPSRYNIFGAQISDGDAFGDDPHESRTFLTETLLPLSRYFVYAETASTSMASALGRDGSGTPLWQAYQDLPGERFDMTTMTSRADVYPALARLFGREEHQ